MFGYYAITKPRLQRERTSPSDGLLAATLAQETQAIADKASKKLGYRAASEALEKTKRLAVVRAEVAAVFAKMNFTPLDYSKVKQYENWFARKYGKKETDTSHGIKVEWNYCALSSYTQVIPAFALSLALEMQENFPEATFHVEYPLARKTLPLDPFLRMDYKGLTYYLEVWDEPEFEGRRTV